jgi:tetratricopeptide (TPR) repeat protein
MKTFEELDAKSECIRMAINIGSIYLSQNKYDKALAIYKSNLANAEKIGDKRLMSACVSHIGDVYSTAGYYEKAMKFYSRDLEIKESLGDKSGISILYGNTCIILYEQGKYLEALEAVDKAIAIDKELNTKVHLMYHLANKAEVMYYLGEYKAADNFNKESMKLTQYFEDEGFLYEAALLACKIDFQTGDEDKKYNQIRKLNRMLADSTNPIHIAELNYQIYKLLKANPLVEIKDADKYREKAILLFKNLNKNNETAKYKKIIAELEVV